MATSARLRLTLAVVPVAVALVVLAVLGVTLPYTVERLSPGVLAAVLTVCALASVAALVVTGLRTTAPARAARAARFGSALAVVVVTVALVSRLLGWPEPIWIGLRAVVATGVAATVWIGTPTRRPLRTWSLVVLDGWVVAASAFLLCWVLLGVTGSELPWREAVGQPVLVWLPFDVAYAAWAVGYAMRISGDRSTGAVLTAAGTVLTIAADSALGLAAHPAFGILLWALALGALGAAALISDPDRWASELPLDLDPPMLRLPQWIVVPGLIVAVIPRPDPVVVVAAVSVILALAAELATSGRQNRHLWHRLRRQAEQLDQLVRESRDVIVQIDDRGVVTFANDALAHVLGFAPDDFVGRNGLSLAHPDDRHHLVDDIRRISEGAPVDGRVHARFRHADGGWRTVEATVTPRTGDALGFTLSARDVSERVTLEAELRRLAGTDALTGLLNRPAFLALLEERLQEGSATVLFVDLDGFKQVNDMDGHAAGDRLLREVADTLRRELRGRDVAARLGGDEFAVLIGGGTAAEAHAVAERLVQRLRSMPADPARRTAASIGVASGTRVPAEVVLGDADLAMYEAKARGGRRHVVFEPWMRARVTERARMGLALEAACAGEGLLLDLQPIVEMRRGRWVGFEALARWQDGDRRREPAEFLPIAEESGLVDPMGRWVLNRSLAWLARWPDPRAGVAVNVAGAQLTTVGFGDWVHQQLAGHGVAPQRLTLEISERTALGDLQRATAVLQPLRAIGVRIALDDFGTGFSSLGHLAELPVDELKIDRRFVAGLGRRAADEALVRAVCGLAVDLGLRVVAEGVETPAQEFSLLELGCELGQGFRFQPPTAPGELPVPAPARQNGRGSAGRLPGVAAQS